MIINNPHETRCSIEGCNSIYIARKKDWICSFHLQMEYNKKSIRGLKSWNKGNKKPIRKVSRKRQIENKIYTRTRKEFLSLPENKICFINGCLKPANTVEHIKGRIGSNYLNQTFWKPCCLEHNIELENNSQLSKKYQLSKLHGGQKI